MRLTLFSSILITAMVFISCNQGAETDGEGLSLNQITRNQTIPTSIFLDIVGKSETDTAVLYTIQGLYEQDTVGFVVSMDRDIPAGIKPDGSVNQEEGFKTGTVKFLRSGPESDAFIAALVQIWDIPMSNSTFSDDAVIPLTFSSNKDPFDHSKSSTNNYKLFFAPDALAPGEVFFTLDTYKRIVELQEKDEMYRMTILEALAAKDSIQ